MTTVAEATVPVETTVETTVSILELPATAVRFQRCISDKATTRGKRVH